MKSGKVKCTGCSNEITPRLWHQHVGSWIFERKSEHICPVCGITMYETGGGFSVLGYIAMSFALLLLVLVIFNSVLRGVGLPSELAFFVSVYVGLILFLWFIICKTGIFSLIRKILSYNNHDSKQPPNN